MCFRLRDYDMSRESGGKEVIVVVAQESVCSGPGAKGVKGGSYQNAQSHQSRGQHKDQR